MKYLSNTYSPKLSDAPNYIFRRMHETPKEAWQNYLSWLDNKIIGRPQATEKYTVEQLEEMGMVGVYIPE